MTKDELIRIYSAYLPHDLKVIRNGEKDEEQLYGVQIHWHKSYIATEFNEYYLEDVKPILYDLSYLTKEIEHEGKKFVPIVELAKLGTAEEQCEVTNSNIGTCYVNAKNEKKGFFIYHPEGYFIWQVGKNAEPLIVKNQLKLFQKLTEWHFNIFQLPENQFINKATLKEK